MSYVPHERGTPDLFDKDNRNIEHLSGLTHCKRCGPAATSFLSSLLAPTRPQLADFKSSNTVPPTKLDHIVYCGSGWLTWEQLCDDSSTARRASGRSLWERPSLDTSSGPKQQVVWHEVLFRALLVHVARDLKHEMQAGEKMLIICFLRSVSEPVAALLAAFLSEKDAKRVDVVLLDSARGLTADSVHVIYSSRFVGGYDQLQGTHCKQTLTDCMWHTLEDDWQLYCLDLSVPWSLRPQNRAAAATCSHGRCELPAILRVTQKSLAASDFFFAAAEAKNPAVSAAEWLRAHLRPPWSL